MPQIYTPEGLLDPTVHVTAGQAAELCGISEDTIRRARKRDLLPGAFQDQSDSYRRWWMPISDLLTAGLLKRTDVAGHHEPPVLSLVSAPVPAPAANAAPRAEAYAHELDRLRAENSRLVDLLRGSQDSVARLSRVVEALVGNSVGNSLGNSRGNGVSA